MSQAVIKALTERFGEAIHETHALFGDDTAVVDPASWFAVAKYLRSEPRLAMDLFIDLTAVDYPEREPRFEVVLHLRSMQHGHRIRVKAPRSPAWCRSGPGRTGSSARPSTCSACASLATPICDGS